jgi:hypothetical protein
MRQIIASVVGDSILPEHATAQEVIDEAVEYAASYQCSAEIAVRDVIDEYHQGAAEAADALRNGDWDYGRE